MSLNNLSRAMYTKYEMLLLNNAVSMFFLKNIISCPSTVHSTEQSTVYYWSQLDNTDIILQLHQHQHNNPVADFVSRTNTWWQILLSVDKFGCSSCNKHKIVCLSCLPPPSTQFKKLWNQNFWQIHKNLWNIVIFFSIFFLLLLFFGMLSLAWHRLP